jgi:hypothetical protein
VRIIIEISYRFSNIGTLLVMAVYLEDDFPFVSGAIESSAEWHSFLSSKYDFLACWLRIIEEIAGHL